MCGIAGIFNCSESTQEAIYNAASLRLKERGPDIQKELRASNHYFFHSRLKIIDLSERANQPFRFQDKVLVYNGEIYNFLALKIELEKQGFVFETQSDTEVVLKGYVAWGIHTLLHKMDGMFAFSIWDEALGKAFLARDRFGKKPLYIYHNAENLAFSSSLNVISDVFRSKLTVNLNAISYYLSELTTPQPQTIWKECRQVKPGHFITYDPKSNQQEEKRYHRWEVNGILKLNENEAIEETEALLKKAISKRLIADVPIGCFLSGGVDSGLITALMAQLQDEPIATFTVGLDHQSFNELPEAKIVADRYNTNHHEIIVSPDVEKDLCKLMGYMDEPFADSSLLPSFYISRAIKKHATVALSGDGGDELFGGYSDYGLSHKTQKYFAPMAGSPFKNTKVIFDKLKYRITRKRESNLGAFQDYFDLPNPLKLYREMGLPPNDTIDLWRKGSAEAVDERFVMSYWQQKWDRYANGNVVDTHMGASLETRLLNDYLVKVDRASMINSLEIRSPFLDLELANFAFSLHHTIKFGQDQNKYILKKIAQKHLDEKILHRPKRGFGIPIHEWLKDELASFWQEAVMDNKFIAKHFDRSKIERLFSDHKSGIKGLQHILWAFLCLSLWSEKHKL